jgi:arylsulfatase A-like enzyme
MRSLDTPLPPNFRRLLSFGLLRACLFVGSLLLMACAAQDDRKDGDGPLNPPKHVFLITVDTLRADHLGSYGYPRATSPAIDQLAQGGVLFERAIAQWPKTGPSFASIFTGRYPHTTGLTHKAALHLPDAYLTLPEFFSANGYTTVAVVSNGVLAKRLGWNQGFDEYLQTWDLAPEQSDVPEEYRHYINARRVNELAEPLLERHRNAENLFVWLHYSDPHAPYLLPNNVSNPFLGDTHYTEKEPVKLENPRAAALGEETELRYYIASYDANVLEADRGIESLLGHARTLQLLQDSLVVFTADHGESLGEHGYFFGHGRLPHNPGSHVPLVFHRPDGGLPQGRRVEQAVELVDLYPTLLALVAPEKEVPGLEGQSLVSRLVAEPKEAVEKMEDVAFSEAGGGSPLTHFRSVQNRHHKLVFHPPLKTRKGPQPERYHFYDLAEDPGEKHDLLATGTDLSDVEEKELRRLRRALLAWMEGRTWIEPPEGQLEAENEEMLKTLRALGYIP